MSDFGFGDRVMISAGGRLDRVNVRNRGGFFGDRSRNDTAFSGYAGLSFTPVAEWTATIQAARGYRDPTLSDRYFRGISGRGFVVGNPDLEPETTRQFDASVRWQRGQQSLSLFGYHYRIRDLVERYRAATDFHFRNRGEAEVKGVEIEAATPLPYKLSLHVAAAVARGEVLDDDAALDDIAMPNAHVALQWSLARTVTFLDASFYARDTRPGPVETSRPAIPTSTSASPIDCRSRSRCESWAGTSRTSDTPDRPMRTRRSPQDEASSSVLMAASEEGSLQPCRGELAPSWR